jgi:hypothetical protein
LKINTKKTIIVQRNQRLTSAVLIKMNYWTKWKKHTRENA